MNANEAELTVVLEHDASGRILRFVKTVIPLAAAESMKAKAVLAREEMKVAALLQDTDAVLERAHAPSTSEPAAAAVAAARPVPQQRVARPPVSTRAPAASRPVTLTAHAEAKRREQAQLDAQRIKAEIEATRREVGAFAGKEAGKAVMIQTLGILRATVPPGTKGYIEGKQIDLSMQETLQLLHKRYPAVNTPEFNAAFAHAFTLGVHEAVAHFEANPAPAPAPQATDAGATQDASV
jgi:hypothetical protein